MADEDQLRELQTRVENAPSLEEALAASKQLVEILGPLAEQNPAKYALQLATAWKEYGTSVAVLEGPSTATEPLTTSVRLFRDLATETNPTSLIQMAFALQALAQQQLGTGDAAHEALATLQEAHEVCQRFAREVPEMAKEIDATVSHLHATACYQLGDYQTAITYGEQAADCLRRAERKTLEYAAPLADTLKILALSLLEEKRLKDARKKIEDAQYLYRRLSKRDPLGYLGELANATYTYATIQMAEGKDLRAVGTFHAAVDTYAKAVQLDPELEQDYRTAVDTLVNVYEAIGNHSKANKLRQQHGL